MPGAFAAAAAAISYLNPFKRKSCCNSKKPPEDLPPVKLPVIDNSVENKK